MKARLITCLMLLIVLPFLSSCTQQSDSKATPDRKSQGKNSSSAKQPVKVSYLTGEILRINPTKNNLIVRGRNGDLEMFTDKKTIIKSGGQGISLSDLSSREKASVRYVSIGDKNIAKSIFIAEGKGEERESLKRGDPPAEPQSAVPSDQPSRPSAKK